jgi:hypothetical protein
MQNQETLSRTSDQYFVRPLRIISRIILQWPCNCPTIAYSYYITARLISDRLTQDGDETRKSKMKSQLENAIARSQSHNEIVNVEIVASDISEVIAELNAIYDGEIDSSTENDGSEGIWGWTEDMAEGQMDWRINVTLVAE